MLSPRNIVSVVVPVVLVVIALSGTLAYFILRHRRLQRSFSSFANSHYDTRSGAATFSGGDGLGKFILFCAQAVAWLVVGLGVEGNWKLTLYQGCTNPVGQVVMVTRFCMVVPNAHGCSVWNLLHVTHLAPGILRGLISFWMSCAPNIYMYVCVKDCVNTGQFEFIVDLAPFWTWMTCHISLHRSCNWFIYVLIHSLIHLLIHSLIH